MNQQNKIILMEENKQNTVSMTDKELEAFRAYQAAEARKAEEERAKKMRDDYSAMVDEQIDAMMPELVELSGSIRDAKQRAYEQFKAAIELKKEMFRLKKGEELDVQSHTFTNSRSDMRITLGAYQIDNYRDTAEEGISIVREYISSLAKDEASEALVKMVLKLLSRDRKGTLKASRIIQLHKLADETGSPRFIEGVRIIEDAYAPVPSKTYVKAEVRGENGEWKSIPLGMTES